MKTNGKDLDNYFNELGMELEDASNQIETFKKQTLEIAKMDVGTFPQLMVESLNGVITRGNNILNKVELICNSIPDPEIYNAAASVLNSINSLISNFLSLYKIEKSRLDKIELENLGHQHKMEQIKLRSDLRQTPVDSDDPTSSEVIPFNTADILLGIVNAEKK
jgi:lantibiotic modifying enzyme